VKEAGTLSLQMRSDLSVSEKGPGDFVTDADRALSKLLVFKISQRMPGDLIVSEEGDRQQAASRRTWLIDPIDGTDHYLHKKSDQFSVMVGLVLDGVPAYGWVCQPARNIIYHGGVGFGAFVQVGDAAETRLADLESIISRDTKRIIIGRRDSRNRPWLRDMTDVSTMAVGSVGVKVIWVLENRADIVAQMHGLMSVWDTAAPAALALGAGMEVGTDEELKPLRFPAVYDASTYKQRFPVVFGRPGTIEWSRKHLMTKPSL